MAVTLGQRRDIQVDDMFAGIARGREIDPIFIHGTAVFAHLIDQRQQRAAERDQFAQQVTLQQRHRDFKEILGRDIGVDDLAIRGDDDDWQWQRVHDRVRTACEKIGGAKTHAAALNPGVLEVCVATASSAE